MESKAPSVNKVTEIVLYTDNDFSITCEDAEGIPFLHCNVEKYNKEVFRRLHGVWQELEEAFRAHGHVEVFTYAKGRAAKFAKRFGDAEVIDSIEHFGEEYEVIRWAL